MRFFRCHKLRNLYLLALLQLVGGPLVLLNVSLFCKLTLTEAPRVGITAAAAEAWQSETFQTTMAESFTVEKSGRKEGDKPQSKKELPKHPPTPWSTLEAGVIADSVTSEGAPRTVTWTPRWPNAPPGPPPRIS